jgi:hypothetical protein
MSDRIVRKQTDVLLFFRDGFFILPQLFIGKGQAIVWPAVSRIGLNQKLTYFNALLNLSSYIPIVIVGDVEFFSFADPVSQFIRFTEILRCQPWLDEQVVVYNSELRVGHCEVWVELNGAFEVAPRRIKTIK